MLCDCLDERGIWGRIDTCICMAESLCSSPGTITLFVGKIPWRRKWQPMPVFLPEESHGLRSLVGYNPQGCKELDTTEGLHFTSLHTRIQNKKVEEELRWQRNRIGIPLSPPQLHWKNIWMLSKLHKTTSERWQRTSGNQKSSPLSLKGVENLFTTNLEVLLSVLDGWRSLEATGRIRLKTRGRTLKPKTWEHQRTPDYMEH